MNLQGTQRIAPILMLSASLLAGTGKAQVPHSRLALGGNVNERFHWATPQVLDQTHTTWIRGFIPASEFISGKRSYKTDAGLLALKQAAESGHKVVLSIKWDSTGKGEFGRMPPLDSKEERQAFSFVDQLLDATSGKIAVLVLINELSIDTMALDLAPDGKGRIPVIEFLKRVAEHVDAEHRLAQDGSPLPLFGGGMTRLDKRQTQDAPATRAMIEWVNADSKIAGADFHIHQPDMATTEAAVEYIHREIRRKPLMVTEMSLIWKWKAHMGDIIGNSDSGREFAVAHQLTPQMTVADYFTHVFQQPVPEREWRQFLAAQPWFEGHYLQEVVPILQNHGVKIATYALTWNPHTEEAPPPKRIGSEATPWFLNQLLVPGMCSVPDSGRFPENFELLDDYRDYQKTSHSNENANSM